MYKDIQEIKIRRKGYMDYDKLVQDIKNIPAGKAMLVPIPEGNIFHSVFRTSIIQALTKRGVKIKGNIGLVWDSDANGYWLYLKQGA